MLLLVDLYTELMNSASVFEYHLLTGFEGVGEISTMALKLTEYLSVRKRHLSQKKKTVVLTSVVSQFLRYNSNVVQILTR
jgi:hypothetical protein